MISARVMTERMPSGIIAGPPAWMICQRFAVFMTFGGGRRFGGLRHESCAEGEGREPRKDNFH